jgi:hypothetical protein
MSAQSHGVCRGRGESFQSALFSFFKSRVPNFEISKGFDRTARIWWSQQERYLTEQELLDCADDVPYAHLKQDQKRSRLERNAGGGRTQPQEAQDHEGRTRNRPSGF